jgi:HTH-type transcriptional regulator / antitoxin HigA
MEVMSSSVIAIHGKMDRNDVDEKEYRGLVGKSLPHVIRTEKENEYYIDLLYSLDKKESPTAAERELADLLTLLIEAFEDQHYALKHATPIESLAELMEANGLKQKDLVNIFGTPSIVSEVLSGKRRLTVEHIEKLSKRFNVSPELFIR